ncbi:MAG: response regulator [Firmicutes bacterium]|nr:response regulator [Bacillota bacterium]
MNDRKTILAVDDSAANLQIYKGILSPEYDVRLAKSGKLALVALKRIIPQLLLFDIEMPDLTGFEIKEEINKNDKLKNIPVIFVTSHATESIVAKAISLGAVDYVVKPFAPEMLLTKIEGIFKNIC